MDINDLSLSFLIWSLIPIVVMIVLNVVIFIIDKKETEKLEIMIGGNDE